MVDHKQDSNVKQAVIALDVSVRDAEIKASQLVKGLYVTINEKFHDQDFGTSKPNLCGKQFKVTGATLGWFGGEACLWLDGVQHAVPISMLTF